MSNTKRKHHYITRFYLEGFCDRQGRIWTYPKSQPDQPYSNKPNTTAAKRDFYSIEGGNHNLVEDILGENFETPAVDPFRNLKNKKFPGDDEKQKLAIFFGILMFRTPLSLLSLSDSFDREVHSFAMVSAKDRGRFHTSYANMHSHLTEEDIEKDRQSILNGETEILAHKNFRLANMLNFGSIAANYLYKMKWVLIETNEVYPFITTDNPIQITHPRIPLGFNTPGPAMIDTRVSIPISSRLCLLMVNNQQFNENVTYSVNNPPVTSSGVKVNLKTLAKELNKSLFIRSHKYAFACANSEKLIRCFSEIKRTEGSHE